MDYMRALAQAGCPPETAAALNDLWLRVGLREIVIGSLSFRLRQTA